jgi:hypothetical protein
MNCDEYVERFLSADADDQLPASDRALVEEHLRGCLQCRTCLNEELALKALIRRQMGSARAPADARLRIRAALGETAERHSWRGNAGGAISARDNGLRQSVSSALRGLGKASASARRAAASDAGKWVALQFKRAQHLAPAGVIVIVLIASTIIFGITFKSTSIQPVPEYQKAVPAFDFAIGRFKQLSQNFDPNVPAEAFRRDDGAYFAWVENTDPLHHVSAELPDISESYEKVQMPPEFCDFALAGYELIGGRIDRTPDGEPLTYTLYRSQTDSILSIGLKRRISAPLEGYWFDNHALYSYRGYSICLTVYPSGHFSSIIVTRAPRVELLRDVATSDVALGYR